MPNAKYRTARHFDVGERVYHKEAGLGVIEENESGQKYPRFPRSIGTPYTRVISEAEYKAESSASTKVRHGTKKFPDGTKLNVTFYNSKEGK